MVVVLYPFTAVWLLADRNDAFISTWTLIICGSVLLLLYLKDTFLFFSGKKISIFYWILYLCTAILLPWSLLIKLLAGQVMM
jgi:Ca2+/Na+ antiporter